MESEKTRIYKADGWISEGRIKGNLNLTYHFYKYMNKTKIL